MIPLELDSIWGLEHWIDKLLQQFKEDDFLFGKIDGDEIWSRMRASFCTSSLMSLAGDPKDPNVTIHRTIRLSRDTSSLENEWLTR